MRAASIHERAVSPSPRRVAGGTYFSRLLGGAGNRFAGCLVLAALLLPSLAGSVEIPYDALFVEESPTITRSPFRDQEWSADPQLKVGQGSLRASRLRLGIDTDLDVPLREAPPPDDAMLRIWRLYANMPRTYFELIASDNADRTKHDRKQGAIAMLATDFEVLLQLTENLQIVSRGRFVYLPFEGQGGFQGFFDDGDLSGSVDIGSDLFVEARFDGILGQWDYFLSDRIGLSPRSTNDLFGAQSADVRLSYLGKGEFDKADRLGRYSLGEYGRRYGNRDNMDYDENHEDRWKYSVSHYFNRAVAGISRTIPTETLVGLTVFRHDRWGMDGRGWRGRDTEWKHGLNLSLINQHDNVRFKPYLTYTASNKSDDHFWRHVARLGIFGPISDYLDLDANVGYAWRSAARRRDPAHDSRSLIWHVSLHNELNQLTSHRLSYTRRLQPDTDQIHTSLVYSLHRILGPYLDSALFAARTEVDYGDRNGINETRYETGARLAWDVSSRLDLSLTGSANFVRRHDGGDNFKEYLARLAADYDLTETISLLLSYEYLRRTDDRTDRSYTENMVRLRLTKHW